MNKVHILLIDDDVLSLRSLEKALQLNGFQVDAYSNPLLAWDNFKRKSYNLVMSDIMMEPIDGFRMLRLFQNANPDIRIILFTGNLTNTVRAQAERIGADHFFNKPIPIEKIFTILKNMEKELVKDDTIEESTQ